MSSALNNLNDLFASGEDRVVFQSLEANGAVTIGHVRDRIGRLMTKLEARPEKRWLLYSMDPCNFTVGMLSLLALKREVVISPGVQTGLLQEVASDFDAILTDTSTGTDKPSLDFTAANFPATARHPQFSGQEILAFLTSGSTGAPKPIRKPLQALTNEVSTLAATFPENTGNRIFATSVSHLHIYGLLFNILLPLLYRASSLPRMIEFQEQLHAMQAHFGKLVFVSSPAFLSRLDNALPTIELQQVFSSGGPLAFSAAQTAQQCFSTLPVEVYGSTETGGIGYRQQAHSTTPWQAFEGVSFSNVNDETAVQSPNMPDQPPYVLDDRLTFFDNGQFMLKGRKDRIVKIEEKRVSLSELETCLLDLTDIAQCHAVVLAGQRTRIGVIVVLSESGKQTLSSEGRQGIIKQWKALLKLRFEPVAIPRRWQISDNIPVNSQGKVDYRYLLSLFDQAD